MACKTAVDSYLYHPSTSHALIGFNMYPSLTPVIHQFFAYCAKGSYTSWAFACLVGSSCGEITSLMCGNHMETAAQALQRLYSLEAQSLEMDSPLYTLGRHVKFIPLLHINTHVEQQAPPSVWGSQTKINRYHSSKQPCVVSKVNFTKNKTVIHS